MIHALHTNELPFINGGEHVTVIPEVPTWLSLAVILVTLVVTTVMSLAKSRRDRRERVLVEPAATDPTALSAADAPLQDGDPRPTGSAGARAGSVSAATPGRSDR